MVFVMLGRMQKKLILILLVATVFAYLSSLGNPFIWDDEQFITQNAYVQTFDIAKLFTTNTVAGAGIVSNYYRPLTSLSFAIDAKLWGQNPFGFHLTNLFFHVGAGVLLFLLLLELGAGQWGSFFISLFFLIHPVQVEAVSYINSRGDSLFALLLLSAFYCFTQGVLVKKAKWLLISGILYISSILAKETALFGLPIFLGILAVLWSQGVRFGKTVRQVLLTLAFFVAAAVGYIVLRLTVLNFQNTLNFYTSQDLYSTHLVIRLATFCKIFFVYVGLLLFPYPLHMERSVSLVTSIFSPWVLGAVAMVVLVTGGLWFVYRKTHNLLPLFGFFWMGVFLAPVSGIIPINGILYEHWLYLPMVGFFLMVVSLGMIALKYMDKKGLVSKILLPFVTVTVCLYIVLTIRQNNIWADPVTFYRYTLSFAPTSVRLHNNLGMVLANQGDNRQAVLEYQKALRYGPEYAVIYNNLGNAEIALGQYQQAEKDLDKALSLSPGFVVPRQNLLKLYIVSKQYDKALKLAGNNIQVRQYIEQVKAQ